ncbi:hypothetical protein RCO48_28375 [Peribacillus frigoritolerans]|nr:hypothetical protein [Peribacillus frigoritolerans]
MLKPYLVVEWNDTETDAKGWLVVHNFVKGYTGGSTRCTQRLQEKRSKGWPRLWLISM